MPLKEDLISQIEKNIALSLVPEYKTKAHTSDTFEAFVMSIILKAAVEADVQTPIEWETTQEKATKDILFRRSPGHVNDSKEYTHAILKFPNTPSLEVHLGIYVVGVSGVPQECDIAIIYADEAQRCRRIVNGGAVVRSTKVFIGVECKCYQNSKLSLNMGRAFLGLKKDLSNNGTYYFAFNDEKTSVKKLLARHHKEKAVHNLMPFSKKEKRRFQSSLENMFEDLKAKHQIN